MRACAYCGVESESLVLDHVVPRARGGPDSPRNLVEACAKCNGSKSDLLPSEWLTDVPKRLAAIEAAVCRTVELRVRGTRGRKSRTTWSDEFRALIRVLAAKWDMDDGLTDLEVICAAKRYCQDPETVWKVLREAVGASVDDDALGHLYEVASIALELRRVRADMGQCDMLAASRATLRRVAGHQNRSYFEP